MKSGLAPTGTLTSCLMDPPSAPWTSESSSRNRQKALRCCSVAAIRVLDDALLDRALKNLGQRVLDSGGELRGDLDEDVPCVRRSERIARARNVSQNEFEPDPGQ